jgi:hypothetical protein
MSTRQERLQRPKIAEAARLAALIGFVAALAAAELLIGTFGRMPAPFPRAEALAYFEVRPWILIVAALILTRFGWRWRLLVYALFLVAAGLAESRYLLRLGNPSPWGEMLRGWGASALLLVPIEAGVQLARRRFGGWGAATAALVIAVIVALPPVLTPLHAFVAGPDRTQPATTKPDLLLMTALPIIWGEGGAFDPSSRPAVAYRVLQEEFATRPIDTLDPASLGGGNLLLLAQPRWLAPSELVDLDHWVRRGGNALILTDPRLVWPSALPLGDIRRPPPVGLLKPLLDHWGLEIRAVRRTGSLGHPVRRVALQEAGELAAQGRQCRVSARFRAECRIGRGRAIVIADADLLHDELWVASGADGDSRRRRLADNPLFVADELDRLSGVERERVRAPVIWATTVGVPGTAFIQTFLPLLAIGLSALCAAVLLHRRRKV